MGASLCWEIRGPCSRIPMISWPSDDRRCRLSEPTKLPPVRKGGRRTQARLSVPIGARDYYRPQFNVLPVLWAFAADRIGRSFAQDDRERAPFARSSHCIWLRADILYACIACSPNSQNRKNWSCDSWKSAAGTASHLQHTAKSVWRSNQSW